MGRTNFQNAEEEFSKVIDHYVRELSKLRSGRANPDLVSDIKVEAYGQQMPINQLANINVSDPSLLVIQPWDKTITEEVVKAIKASDIGIQPAVDGEIIRLPMPPLTQERREEYVKILGKRTEDARVSIRQLRKDILLGIEEDQEAGNLSEDEKDRKEKELQTKVEEYNTKIEEISKSKEEELMQV